MKDFIIRGTEEFIQKFQEQQMYTNIETSGKTMPSAELLELMDDMTEKLQKVAPVYWEAYPCSICRGHNPERPIHYEIAWKTRW